MKKTIVYIIFFILFLSCSMKNKIYLECKENPNQKDKYSEYCHFCLFVILDGSLAENKVLVAESKNTDYSLFPNNIQLSDTIYYNKQVPKKAKNDCEEIIKAYNKNALDIFVNNDSILVRNFAFSAYRFVIVKKKNNSKKPVCIFTNDISGYPKVVERLNKEIPEITLIKD